MITRRKLLYTGAALTGAGLFAPLWAGAALAQEVSSAASDDIESFRQLSMFLLERSNLDAALSLRILAQCTRNDPAFPEKIKALWSKIGQHHLRNVGQLSGSPHDAAARRPYHHWDDESRSPASSTNFAPVGMQRL